ncbi:Uncharacterized protein YyaL [hydrothermal vent metagenome]|uniref:Uncharacterized protein YyaL n=1 Tax=hydrothermal vent metagenome TaxID=652676 RepID=A0A3B0WES6_9ZZZZ
MHNPHNKLKNETSPYLLQHANNPVNWHPWNKEALALAKTQNKPILLSIGYSACHWCHVMAHESFEDNATAEIMNKHFINIKVDREERPDLDKIYQTAHSLLTSRSGGWPLTVFLSPINQMPFFAGTYFPDKSRYNQPAFSEIMELVNNAYFHRQAEIQTQEDAIQKTFNSISSHTPTRAQLNSLPLDLARKQISSAFDKHFGGFSGAPKFPHPGMLERCLRHYLFLNAQNKNDADVLNMAIFTLDKMALGGFQDQIGGGFYRYSTDEFWMIPHFEKMLYDNAQLLNLYAQAYLITQNPLYKQTLDATARWLIHEIQTEEGGYCSALDADTDKIEGLSYVWMPEQIKSLLTSEEFTIFEQKYNLSAAANFEGSWHLHGDTTNQTLSTKLNFSIHEIETHLQAAKTKLLSERNTRNQPGRDDKILCAWNALMIRSMAHAGRCTQNKTYIDSALKSTEFIYSTLWRDQRLLASYKDGKAHLNAYLDDYAYLLQAIIELLQSTWSNRYYQWAIEIANNLLLYFEDTNEGAFFFTSHDHETLLYKSKTFADDAIPNGNAVAASSLIQLGYLSGDNRYLDAAERTLRCGHTSLSEHAISHCSLLHALELYLVPNIIIVLRGNKMLLKKWQNIANSKYIPQLVCVAIDNETTPPESLNEKKSMGNICAYICENTLCLPVINDEKAFQNYLNKNTHY